MILQTSIATYYVIPWKINIIVGWVIKIIQLILFLVIITVMIVFLFKETIPTITEDDDPNDDTGDLDVIAVIAFHILAFVPLYLSFCFFVVYAQRVYIAREIRKFEKAGKLKF